MDPKAPDLEAIRWMIDNQIDDIDCRWREALAVKEATMKACGEALAAARAGKAAPGSIAEVKKAEALWQMLRAAAVAAVEACDKARPKPRRTVPKPKRLKS
jgi:hypothetical protein